MKKLTITYILSFILLSSYVSATVNWINPSDIRDDLYGMLIYNGNISITFDGDFSVNNSGFDTNESVRFDMLVGTNCTTGDFVYGINDTGGVICDTPAVATDTNESTRFDMLVGTDCDGTGKVIGINATGGILCGADVDTDTQLSDAEIEDFGYIKLANVSIVDTDTNCSGQTCDVTNIGTLDGYEASALLDDTKWITDKPYLYNDSDTIYFNSSQFEVTYYNATSIEVVTGTGSGTLEGIQTYNIIPYNVTEVSSDYELLVNFTEVDDFTTLIIRYKTDVDAGHTASIQIWDYEDSDWEDYGLLTESTTYEVKTLGVYDSTDHIDGGIVQVRFYQDEKAAPPTTHIHEFDWIVISKGFGTPVGQEIDPLSIHRDGNTPFNSNWNTGIYTITMEGELIINNLTTSEDIRPALNNIYSLGNTTNWFKELYVTDIHNTNFYGEFVNASEINSSTINSNNVNSTTIQVDENITLGGNKIIRQDENFAIVLS